MKLLRSDNDQYTFGIGRREKHLLVQVLQLYPLVPPAHHHLIQGEDAGARTEDQRLLEEALAEQREQNRRQVLALLEQPDRFREIDSNFELSLSAVEMEWLLQVLNDVRVGAWLTLGEPKDLVPPEITKVNAPFILAMATAGQFQSDLLTALGVRYPRQFEE